MAAGVCEAVGDCAALRADTFAVILSNFTVEHFADPSVAFADLYRSLRPGGTLVVTTVNQRHPFVGAYLALPDRQRAAIVLRFYEDLTEAQTAAAMGVTVGTVKSQVSDGLKKLRARLGPDVTAELVPNEMVVTS